MSEIVKSLDEFADRLEADRRAAYATEDALRFEVAELRRRLEAAESNPFHSLTNDDYRRDIIDIFGGASQTEYDRLGAYLDEYITPLSRAASATGSASAPEPATEDYYRAIS
jgi:hypothetical protein